MPDHQADTPVYVTGFLHGLNESGYVEGKNVTTDYQWARV